MPKPKKSKKMHGPKKFVKTTSKRKSVKRPPTRKHESKSQASLRVEKMIADSKKSNKKVSVRTISKQPRIKKPFVQKKILSSTLLPGQERLEKELAQAGLASRREAKTLIKRGLVTVNGKSIREPGFGVVATDTIKIKGGIQENKQTLLFYKPRGVETSKTDPANTDIHDKFPQFAHLNPIGRLDKDTEGLILLSDDGVLARTVTGEDSTVEKEYRVTVREDLIPVLLKKMENGIILDGVATKPCVAVKVATQEYTITLTEGRKHQVRRMANACKLTVTRLVRVRIGNLTVGKMTSGNFKQLTPAQVAQFKK